LRSRSRAGDTDLLNSNRSSQITDKGGFCGCGDDAQAGHQAGHDTVTGAHNVNFARKREAGNMLSQGNENRPDKPKPNRF
jgi:hypothetical protein